MNSNITFQNIEFNDLKAQTQNTKSIITNNTNINNNSINKNNNENSQKQTEEMDLLTFSPKTSNEKNLRNNISQNIIEISLKAGTINNNLNYMIENQNNDIYNSVCTVISNPKRILNNFENFVSQTTDYITNTAATLGKNAQNLISNSFDNIINEISKTNKSLGKAIEDLAENVVTVTEDIVTWAKDTFASIALTAAIAYTSGISGINGLLEKGRDGLIQACGIKADITLYLFANIVGIFDENTKQKIIIFKEYLKKGIRELIAINFVEETNKLICEKTKIGKIVNDTSLIKYDDEIAKKISNSTETAAKIIISTLTGPFSPIFGFSYGIGEQAENLYQKKLDANVFNEIGIYFNGICEMANWLALSKLGNSTISLKNIVKTNGFKNTFISLAKGVKAEFSLIKSKGIPGLIKTIEANSVEEIIRDKGNIISVVGNMSGKMSNWLTGKEKITFSAIAELCVSVWMAWSTNILTDGVEKYFLDSKLINAANNLGDTISTPIQKISNLEFIYNIEKNVKKYIDKFTAIIFNQEIINKTNNELV